jgi:PiT family inorganic phosphate transporter
MNNSFFARFMPKEPKFYDLLRQMAVVSAEAAILVIECIKTSDFDEVVVYAKKIKAYETKGDNTLIQIFEELNSTFITPFDREDIHNLANCLDDVMDFINSAAKKIMLYRPKQIPESALILAQRVDKASDIVLQAVTELASVKKNATNIKELCNELHEIENDADEVFEEFLSNLFANEKDSIEIIKLKEIMQELEKATDAAEGVGKIIKTIIFIYLLIMVLLVIIIALALIFDFINGFHDAANSIATIVSTKVLTPFQAVIWAAAFNFVAFFIAKYIIGEFGIANTVSKSVIQEFITLPVILSGLIAAISWNLLTWWWGIPSSSSHTLIGGFAGAAIMSGWFVGAAYGGFAAVKGSVILKIASFIFLAPLIGMLVAMLLSMLLHWICVRANPHKASRWFKHLQLGSSALFSIGHGLNDSQKVMGIIAAALIAAHPLGLGMGIQSMNDLPSWVALACFTMISLGTMFGGWKIVKTMGTRITKVTPLEGVVAETAGALTLYLTEILKIPVSTTHTITGAIIGVGATKRLSAVRWGVTKDLLIAWILTIPVSGLLAAMIYSVVRLFLF